METNLRRGIIATFGITFFLMVVMIVVWKFKFYDDVNAQLTQTAANYSTQKGIAADLSKNQLAAAIAQDRVLLAKDELDYFQKRFRALNINVNPDSKGGDGNRNATWVGWMREYFSEYGLAMRKELVNAAQETDVVLNTTVKVQAPPQLPELVAAPPSGFLRPIQGDLSVEVVGSLPDILRFLDRVNRSAILMTVGNIKIEGPGSSTAAGGGEALLPKATFTIAPYLLAKGPSVQLTAGAAAPVAGSSTGEEGMFPSMSGSPSATSASPGASPMPISSPMPSGTAARP
jgi:hypothetical protein